MKRILLTLSIMLHTQFTLAQEWLPQQPVSFYEIESDWRLLERSLDTPRFGLHQTDLQEPFIGPPERPHGFGRELDDQSPADFDGLTRDTTYFFGYQFAIVGLLYVLPESVSAWTDEQKEEYNFEKWKHNVTHPRWDPDVWYINYILHPYWGMTYYTRGRERGLTEVGAFWYSFTLSCL
ncbi:MAG: DUF3943 domain-containing protein, partial [Chromatiales bacterium]